jgi:stearoyl-CoA desaturase (Delta-9 desaturase)
MPLTPRREGHQRTTLEKCRAGFFLFAVHAMPVVAILRGTVLPDWITALVVHLTLAFLIASGLHRYFAHHAYRTGRVFQFLLAAGTCLSFTDPIGFAGKHRIHHRYSDTEDDVHNPEDGWWSCWVWSLADDGLSDGDVIAAAPDLARVPELMLLHRYFWVPGVSFAAILFAIGGFSLVAIGYVFALMCVLHLTSAVNYVCHRWGSRRYATDDASRNNIVVALLTHGEGWHNNHHHYPTSARAGFAWWEIDANYVAIRILAALGIVWEVREVPAHVRQRGGIS